MEVIILILVLSFFAIGSVMMDDYTHGPAPIKPAPPQKAIEEPIEKVIERAKEKEKQDKINEDRNWRADYVASLPLEEHPDYFEIDPDSDDVDVTKIYSAAGLMYQIEYRTSKEGHEYSLYVDPITKIASVQHRSLKWEVQLDKLPSKV